jgi:hypothetical protein
MEVKAAKVSKDHSAFTERSLALDRSNIETQETLKKDFHTKYQQMIADKQALIDQHHAALKQRIDELAARDTRYIADLNKQDQAHKDTIKLLEDRQSVQLKDLSDQL